MPDESKEPAWRRYRRFWGPDPTRDVDDELAFHLAMRIEEFEQAGCSRGEAEERAMSRFGNVSGVREECHELSRRRAVRKRRATWWDALRQDTRYALKTLSANWSFTLAVVLTMALGIGATSSVFSVAYGVLLRPLPYRDAEELVRLWSRKAERGLDFFSVSPADYREWKAQSRSLTAMGAFERQRDVTLTRGGEREAVELAAVTPEVFALLGTPARLGRGIVADDAGPGAASVVVLSHEAWLSRFGSDPTLIGKDVHLDDRRFIVVGVMPPRFSIPGTPALMWTPLSLTGASDDHSNRYLRVLGRLAPGVGVDRARDELDVIAARLASERPATNGGWSVNIMSVPEMIVGRTFRRAVLVLLGVVGFVLLIACANAANLQLARAATRGKEMAVRAALGASRGRIATQLLTETAVLALLAGGVGLVIAFGGVDLLRSVGETTIPRLEDVRLDAPVLVFTAVITLTSGVLFGLVPAVRASRTNLSETLKQGTRGMGRGLVGEGVRSALVITEVTLSLILLIGAGLLMRSFTRLNQVEVGFDPRGVVLVPVRLPEAAYREPERVLSAYDRLLERVRAVPGISSASLVSSAPFAGPNTGLVFARLDKPLPEREQAPDADSRSITPGYLRTIGIPLLRGRDLATDDAPTAPGVALVSETTARQYWPNEDPIGSRIRLDDPVDGPVVTVVGVVGDARYQSLETPETRPMMYFPAAQRRAPMMTLVLRTAEPSLVAPAVRQVFSEVDPTLSPPSVGDLNVLLGRALETRRFALVLFGIFAGAAAVLAGIGIYAVMSFLVRQRTHELGIRIALGATGGMVMRSVVARALRVTLAGVLLGLLGAWLLTRSMGALLFETSATDGLTFVGVAALIVALGALASFVPARRATRADPLSALRGEA